MRRLLTFVLLMLINIFVFAQKDTVKIVILHSNDMHAKIDKMSKTAYMIQKIKSENPYVLVVGAGDNFTGNPIVDKYPDQGFPMIEIMNDLGYDISCIGNHEFDYGQETLNKRISQANFPFISANIKVTDSAVLKQPKPIYKIVLSNGISIGFLGLIQLDPNGLPASNPVRLGGLKFYEPIKYAKKFKNYRDSFDIFIGLTHLGIETDEVLAKKLPVFDAIIGGHSHTVLPTGKVVKNTLIVQAGNRNDYLGVMTILYYNGEVVSISDSLIDTKTITGKDKNIDQKVAVYNNNPAFTKVIGFADNDLANKDELGALMTDAMIDTTGAEIAFQNIGGIRVPSIPKGDITVKSILELSPFANTLVVLELTKSEIIELIKYAYNLENENELQVSGIQMELYTDKNDKLTNVILKDYNGKEIQDKIYKVVINDYMSLAYTLDFLKDGFNTYIIDANATMRYVVKKSPINYQGVSRIKVIKSE